MRLKNIGDKKMKMMSNLVKKRIKNNKSKKDQDQTPNNPITHNL